MAFKDNESLEYICCSELNYNSIIERIQSYNLSNCIVNSECSVTNTRDFFTNIIIYPNPVKDNLYLMIDENWNKAEIYDISGRIMRSVTLDRTSVDVSSLESGTYIIKLRHGDKSGNVKFVKM